MTFGHTTQHRKAFLDHFLIWHGFYRKFVDSVLGNGSFFPWHWSHGSGLAWELPESFESVREALFRAIDYGYQDMTTSGYIWPVVDVKIKYCQPWLLEEKAKVTAEIIEHENRLKIRYCVVRLSDGKHWRNRRSPTWPMTSIRKKHFLYLLKFFLRNLKRHPNHEETPFFLLSLFR